MSLLYRPFKKENREGGPRSVWSWSWTLAKLLGEISPVAPWGGVLGGLSLGGSLGSGAWPGALALGALAAWE